MKIVLALFGIALFALIPFMAFVMRFITLGIIAVVLIGFLALLRNQAGKGLGELQERKRIDRIHLVYFLMGVVVLSGLMQIDPLRRSENVIHNRVVEATPLGMTRAEVVEVVNNRWRWGDIDMDEDWQLPVYDREALQGMTLPGDTLVGTRLGIVRYLIFLRYEARAIWVFCPDDILVNVIVRKDFRPWEHALSSLH